MKIPPFYYKLPVSLQNMAVSYEGFRRKYFSYNKLTRKHLFEYEKRNHWSYEQKCEFRDEQLKKIVHHAYTTVPYYHNLFDEGGINPDSIKHLDDLKVLPILTKDIINSHFEELISNAFDKSKMINGETGGTTGSATIIKMSIDNVCEQKAVWQRYYRNLGINIDAWHAMMTHRMIMSPQNKRPPYWRYDVCGKQLFYSPFHLNEETFPKYFESLKKSGIEWIVGYPNRLMLFASLMLENNMSLDGQIKFITTGAESLLGYQIDIIEKAFGVRPYQHYGQTEGVANFSQDKDYIMHIDEDFSCVELIPEDSYYRVIGTSLNNFAMPLLRYDTKDTVTYHIDRKGERIVDSIDGRIQDYITLPDGRKITGIGLAFHGTLGIREMQFYQHDDYSITMYIVKGIGEFESDLNKVISYVRKVLGDDIKFDLQYVNEIPKTKSGKKRLVISEIN